MQTHSVVSYADGSFAIPTLPQALASYTKHARLYGTQGVREAAEAEGHGPRMLARLRIDLDHIDGKGRKVGAFAFTVARKRRRRSTDETQAAVVALSVEGLVPDAIGSKLNISTAHVKKLLRAA